MQHGFKAPRNLELVNILFNPKEVLLEEIRKELNGYRVLFEIEPLYRIEHNFDARLILDTLHLNEFAKLAMEIHTIADYPPEVDKTVKKMLLNLLIAKLSHLYDHKEEQKSKQLICLSDVLDYIENHLEEPLDTEFLAKKANFSPRHFTRLFKSIFNITPKKYIMNQRLCKASALICESNLTISQLASKCGYPDSSYFTRLFVEQFKLTPSDYRKAHHSAHTVRNN